MPSSRPPITHFLCLPLVNSASRPQWQTSLQRFSDDVATTPSLGISPRAIRPLGTLHLTFGILSLETEDRKIAAGELLRRADLVRMVHGKTASLDSAPGLSSQQGEVPHPISRDISVAEQQQQQQQSELEPGALPLTTSLSGLHSMLSPSSTSILYAAPDDPTSRLQNLCTAIGETFNSAGLLIQENRPLLLHATIVNTLYDRPRGSHGKQQGPGKSKRHRAQRVDATELIERYATFEWAKDVRVERVSVCKMGAQKIMLEGAVVDEQYEELCHVDLL